MDGVTFNFTEPVHFKRILNKNEQSNYESSITDDLPHGSVASQVRKFISKHKMEGMIKAHSAATIRKAFVKEKMSCRIIKNEQKEDDLKKCLYFVRVGKKA